MNGIEVLAAASLVLTQAGEGSSPSGPTSENKHWSSSGQDTALVQRLRGFESRPVLLERLGVPDL